MDRQSRTVVMLFTAVSVLLSAFAVVAVAGELPPGGTFSDDNGDIHEGNIEAIAAEGITKGCNPPADDRYCPSSSVTRGQMAAFLVRALDLPATSTDFFTDDDGTVFEANANRLAAAGITKGCNPPVNDRYCPDGNVTRGQMAAFLVRAFGYSDDGGGGRFTDTTGSVFAVDIDRLAAAGVTSGCNPPDNDRYCPDDEVKRDQMASFLARALGLSPIVPPAVTFCNTQTSVPESECDALVALYDATAGDQWIERTGWLTDPDPCTWYGITCSAGSVTELTLFNNQLTGPIPAELENLTNLIVLNISGDEVFGPIPAELGNLTNLETLSIGSTQLSGSIPAELGNLTNLTLLLIRGSVSGSIPAELGNLANLEALIINITEVSGPIPAELGNLTNLTVLSLAYNQLSGSIPPELANLAKVDVVSIHHNQLSGSIPPELGNLANLTILWAQSNQLSGSIPTDLANLAKLLQLDLGKNQLSGPIPAELGNLANLSSLWLSDNQLSGSIPAELGNLTNLSSLRLTDNQLSGPVPETLRQPAALTNLSLSGQTGCLTASTTEFATWLASFDSLWNDGC